MGAKGEAIEAAWTDVLRWRDLSRMRSDVPVAWKAIGQASPALPRPADVIEMLGLW
ncbi:hypothetical protein ACIBO6_02200 [Streptomyces luteogriseus]|uniref:hypothetical protein n=1 Tax=Streptomyces luteogriseus TaxID=68233 RepID=UPI003798759E